MQQQLSCLYDKFQGKILHKQKGTPGFEPGTSRSAVECSTTELYPQLLYLFLIHFIYSMIEAIKRLKVDNVVFFTSNSCVILRTGAVIE